MTRARLKAYGLVAGVFLLGVVAGGSVSYAYAQAETRTLFTGDRQAFEHLRLQALERELDLDAGPGREDPQDFRGASSGARASW